VPPGGIGAGKIEFCADGRFPNITTTITGIARLSTAGRTPCMPWIKEGFEGSILENALRRKALFSAEGLPGAWLALYTPLDGARVLQTMAQPVFKTLDSKAIEYEGRFPKAHVVYKYLTGIHLTLDLGDRNIRSHLGQMGIVHAWGELQTLDMVNWRTKFPVRRKPVHGRLRGQVPPSWRSGD